ncbi:MAG: LysR family transcriptional regulator [Polyangiales bacterium]
MDWNDVQHFLALARLGSVRAAGASLGVSHSTVARRVEALEAQLSARLFDRNRDGYVMTAAGEEMLPRAERVEAEMAALERGLVGKDERLSGVVSITCCDHFVSRIVLRELAELCQRYPDIELTLVSDSRPFDLSKREADIALRILGKDMQPPEHLIGTKLVPLTLCNYVGREHAGRLDAEAADTSARWVSFDTRKIHERLINSGSYPRIRPWGNYSSVELLTQAVVEGHGIGMLPTYAGDATPELCRLKNTDLRHVADLWLLSHPDLRDNARLRAVRAAMVEGFRRHNALFVGESGPNNSA